MSDDTHEENQREDTVPNAIRGAGRQIGNDIFLGLFIAGTLIMSGLMCNGTMRYSDARSQIYNTKPLVYSCANITDQTNRYEGL